MTFRNLVAYLVIKIWIKSILPKIVLKPKIGLMKIENPKGLIATKMSPKGEAQNSAQTTKRNWGPICNPITACSLCNIALIDHISLVSTSNCDPFEALDF